MLDVFLPILQHHSLLGCVTATQFTLFSLEWVTYALYGVCLPLNHRFMPGCTKQNEIPLTGLVYAIKQP